MWYRTSYSQNYYFVPNPVPPPFHDLIFNPKGTEIIWYAYCSKDTCYLHIQTASWRNKSMFFWNTATQTTWYPNLEHVTFLHHCENLKLKTSKYKWQKCGWFMLGKNNYVYHIVFINTIYNALLLCTTFGLLFLLLRPMKQESKKDITWLKAVRHSETQMLGVLNGLMDLQLKKTPKL